MSLSSQSGNIYFGIENYTRNYRLVSLDCMLFDIIRILIAMTKDNLKARLAYSTISQLAYVVLGFALANSLGILGGTLQIITHAFGKITLFMCAGSIYVATKKTNISDMRGLGRIMPITFLSFLIGAISIIGLPPLGGSWSKWYLILASLELKSNL